MACIEGDRDPPAAVGDGAAANLGDVAAPWTSPLTPFPFDLPVI